MLTMTIDDFQALVLRRVVTNAVAQHEQHLEEFEDDSIFYEEVQAGLEALKSIRNQLGE